MSSPENDLRTILKQALEAHGISYTEEGEQLLLSDGLQLVPYLVNAKQKEDGHYQTASVVEVRHDALFPDGLFEYQHSWGPTQQESLRSGFNGWIDMDLVTLQEAVGTDKPENLTMMCMTIPADESGQKLEREILFGPRTHYQEHEPPESHDDEKDEDEKGGHEFCPCCLFTNSIDAFTDLLKSPRFLGIRLFASRDKEGHCQADCRVNGHDFDAALPLLKAYAQRWPEAGFEFRKQYVVIRNKPQQAD